MEAQEALDRIKARAAEATPGPWTKADEEGALYLCPPATGAHLVDYADVHQKQADAEFIAHSRSDVDRMRGALAEVLALHYARWTPAPFPGGFICDACREPVESEPCTTVRTIEAKLNEAA